MEKFITAYEEGKADTLKEWMEHLAITDEKLLGEKYFYSFWLLMHQYAPLMSDAFDDHDGETILKNALKIMQQKQLIVEETSEILQFHPQYSIQNMKITLKEYRHELS